MLSCTQTSFPLTNNSPLLSSPPIYCTILAESYFSQGVSVLHVYNRQIRVLLASVNIIHTNNTCNIHIPRNLSTNQTNTNKQYIQLNTPPPALTHDIIEDVSESVKAGASHGCIKGNHQDLVYELLLTNSRIVREKEREKCHNHVGPGLPAYSGIPGNRLKGNS